MLTWLKLKFISFIKGELEPEVTQFFISKGFKPLWIFWMKQLKKWDKDFVERIKKADEEEIEDIIGKIQVKSFS